MEILQMPFPMSNPNCIKRSGSAGSPIRSRQIYKATRTMSSRSIVSGRKSQGVDLGAVYNEGVPLASREDKEQINGLQIVPSTFGTVPKVEGKWVVVCK